MNDFTSAAPSDGASASTGLTFDTEGSDFTVPDYALTAEEAEAVAGIEDFDPIRDIPSPVEFTGGTLKEPESFTVAMLPPRFADGIKAELAKLSPAERERQEPLMVYAAMVRNSTELRVLSGAGSDASPYLREAVDLARQTHDLNQEAYRLQVELAEVVDSRLVPDETTGGQKVQLIEKVQGERRRAYENRIAEIERNIASLNGIEGERRLAKAKKETAEQKIAVRNQIAERAEADAMAVTMERDDRIKRMAEGRAKRLRSNLG